MDVEDETAEFDEVIRNQGNGFAIGIPVQYSRALKLIAGQHVKVMVLQDRSLKVIPIKMIKDGN